MKSVAAINLEIGKDLVVDEIEIPDPRPDQVIVKLISSGVCHSQLHQIHQNLSLLLNEQKCGFYYLHFFYLIYLCNLG